jgi:hypothetical protein
MPFGPRLFVASVYLVVALSFLAVTGTLVWEFWDTEWFTLATHDSHLFLFFPTLGLVALAAFYVPSCVFVDLYWRHIRLGRLRLIAGFTVLAAASYLIAELLGANPYRPVWEIRPQVLAKDQAEPKGCNSTSVPCERLALLEAIKNLQQVSHVRLGVKEFIFNCQPEPLIENSPTEDRKRFCFASSRLTSIPRLSSAPECCQAQRRFEEAVVGLLANPDRRSLTGVVHAWLLPLKVFFLLTLLLVGLLLALRYDGVIRHYPQFMRRIEVGVIAGALAMVFFPLMSQAFVQTASALYGSAQGAGFKPLVPVMSLLFGAWALLLLLFFYRRHDREVELAAKFAGAIASAVAVIKYDLIVDMTVRFLGSGAGAASIGALVLASALLIFVIWSPFARQADSTGPTS